MRISKVQDEFRSLCLQPAQGLEIDVVWKHSPMAGVTTGLGAAYTKSMLGGRTAVLFAQAPTAWDAVCALSEQVHTSGNGYFMRMKRAAQAALIRAERNSLTLAFDDAGEIGRRGFWLLAKNAEEVQAQLGCGLRLVLIVGKRDVCQGGKWQYAFPQIGSGLKPRVRGWDWERKGLVRAKDRETFEFFEDAEATGDRAAKTA